MIKDLPTGLVSALLEGLRVVLQNKFDADDLGVIWLTDNPTLIEPSNNKGTGIVLISEELNNTVNFQQGYWRKRTFNVSIELRASIHESDQPYYVAHNLMEYLRYFLEVTLRMDGIDVTYQRYDEYSQSYIPRVVGKAFSYFESTREPSVRIEERQNGFCLTQCIYYFRWRQED